MELSKNPSMACKNTTPSRHSRTKKLHLLNCLVLLVFILFISISVTNRFPSFTSSAVASHLSFAASYLSRSSSENTCLVTESQDNCALSSLSSVQIRKDSRTEGPFDEDDGPDELSSCDIFDGEWVFDDSDPIYKPGTCPFIGDSFDCFKNGRPDIDYLKYKWKPHGCQIPSFNGTRMLEFLRGKRLVFVGDSLNRNMWESLICSLRESLPEKSAAYEASGSKEFKSQGFYSFKFEDYGCSIDFVKSPFLVQSDVVRDKRSGGRETLRLDTMHGASVQYHDADVVIFNTGHWWTHQKTCMGTRCFQGRLNMADAYRRALTTWAQWVDSNINSSRTRVFFRGYSPSHFRNGQWNSGGHCHGEIEPTVNEALLAPSPWMTTILETIISEMRTPVFYLNVTKMTDYRKDGHPSIYLPQYRGSRRIEDCSHWCLPGVPDAWNHLLYVALLGFSHELA